MQILTQLVFSGIALGMIYAVIAFGYQLTFATSDTLNFGQGEALMLGALVGLTLVGMGVNYWLMIPIVCVFGAIQGAVVERIGVRPAIKIKSEFGWIMSTIALGIIFRNVKPGAGYRKPWQGPCRAVIPPAAHARLLPWDSDSAAASAIAATPSRACGRNGRPASRRRARRRSGVRCRPATS